jgi:dienelactone hydrolase
MKSTAFLVSLFALSAQVIFAAPLGTNTPADRRLSEYFRSETERLAGRCLAEVQSLEDWNRLRTKYRAQLQEMLGLSPLPARTDLKAVITGKIEHEDFTVEKLHFQSRPGLYVTANLYMPKRLAGPAPTVLYLCGHGPVISNGVSYGNKVAYQHHGAWFARNGYVCLLIDTLQLGEIQGLHHGTYSGDQWWWNARGYTSAGVEAWNSIRALDYLSTRPEVDTNRFGATGRSGGGAYSWWIAALDDRIRVAAPVAGITDLQNHVVDGTVSGHCDCMFVVNTYRWDYAQVAALVAPRPLLLVNTDSDGIFPLDGVQRVHAALRRIYRLHRAEDKLGLVIGPGPHKDTQDLQVPVFRWFNRHLRSNDPVIEMAAVKLFRPEQLKVFDQLPADAINTNVQAVFVPRAAGPEIPPSPTAWAAQRESWIAALKEKCFAGWPEEAGPLEVQRAFAATNHGLRFRAFDFNSQEHVRLRLYTLEAEAARKPDLVLRVLGPPSSGAGGADGDGTFAEWLTMMRPAFPKELAEENRVAGLATNRGDGAPGERFGRIKSRLNRGETALAWFAPRGVGLDAWSANERQQVHLRRRFMLLGQTLDGMRVWDIRRAVQALRSTEAWRETPLTLAAAGDLACDALYASLFEPPLPLELRHLPVSHEVGPDYLNVLRVLDIPQAVTLAAERSVVEIESVDAEQWRYPVATAQKLGWNAGSLRFSP